MAEEIIGAGQTRVSAPVRQYDPQDVSVSVDGMIITGLADGTFVTCEKNEDTYEPYVGSQGEVVRAHNANRTGKITFTTDHTSPSNSYLTQLANATRLFPCKVVDMNSDSNQSAGGAECWIVKHPNFDRSGETTEMEWEVFVADYEIL